ncbi:hypothetical protein MPTK1_2g08460 [Marchantia polymorpha subsp. ruderalis]|uniref:Uncharacterized protein n=1 Tax=Marchantia polymorpha TaxID=3197 RepID=A0A2R6XGW2_MARPO|nr:hypothetical protein MARPO_0015s0131 [Marchantia polymorpha]BBN01568.1 hypothetical protein Mp_2g08460 [Marchantia polymorpha subsp. ruderalis]|eukprot:PTQ45334.1 hypothetical protein MARPO_0015s0131 [Marchantia polymorpha]
MASIAPGSAYPSRCGAKLGVGFATHGDLHPQLFPRQSCRHLRYSFFLYLVTVPNPTTERAQPNRRHLLAFATDAIVRRAHLTDLHLASENHRHFLGCATRLRAMSGILCWSLLSYQTDCSWAIQYTQQQYITYCCHCGGQLTNILRKNGETISGGDRVDHFHLRILSLPPLGVIFDSRKSLILPAQSRCPSLMDPSFRHSSHLHIAFFNIL